MRSLPLLCLFLALGCSEFIDRETPTECVGDPCDTVAAVRCSGDRNRELCVERSAECLVWEALDPCSVGQRCSGAGVCGSDDCTPGSVRCATESQVETCGPGADGYLEWQQTSKCEPGLSCAEGEGCVPAGCETEGAVQCADAVSVSTCTGSESGLVWSAPEPCAEGQRCLAGGCGADECETDGDIRCIDDNPALYQVCGEGDDGFRFWSQAIACPANETCFEGACGAHECGPKGLTRCDGDAAVGTCVVGTDGFLAWGPPVPCDEGATCRGDGLCGADECSLNALRCVDDDAERCGFVDSPFTTWNLLEACAPLGVCIDGGCLAHECPAPGALDCVAGSFVRTCVEADTGQYVHGDATPCPELGQTCKGAGICGSDQCVLGATQCADGTSVQTCTGDSVGFAEWKPAVPCGDEDTCQNGTCGADECGLGVAECGDETTVKLCVLHPSGFTVWSEFPCEADGMICLDGGVCAFEGTFELWDEPAIGAPAIVTRADGTFAAAWAAPVFSAFPVMARRFAANGAPTEPAFEAAPPVVANLPYPDIADIDPGDGTSTLVVVWFNADASTLQLRYLGAPGEDNGTVITVSTTALSATPQPTLHPSPSGARVLYATAAPANQAVEAVELPPAGNPEPVLIGTSGGQVLGVSAVFGSTVTVFGGSVSGVTAVSDVASTVVAAAPARAPSASSAPDNTLMLVWVADEDGDEGNGADVVRARRYDAALSPLGDSVVVATGTQLDAPQVVSAGTGYFVVWQGEDADQSGVYGRPLDGTGAPVGSPFVLGDDEAGPQVSPQVEKMADGRLLVVWRDGIGLGARIKARLVDIL